MICTFFYRTGINCLKTTKMLLPGEIERQLEKCTPTPWCSVCTKLWWHSLSVKFTSVPISTTPSLSSPALDLLHRCTQGPSVAVCWLTPVHFSDFNLTQHVPASLTLPPLVLAVFSTLLPACRHKQAYPAQSHQHVSDIKKCHAGLPLNSSLTLLYLQMQTCLCSLFQDAQCALHMHLM